MRKKSIRDAADYFISQSDEVIAYIDAVKDAGHSDLHISWSYDLAIIRLYREFESFMLDCLIALINNDSTAISEKTGIAFPDHMNVAICEYLVIGDGFFNFKGRDGLIGTIKKFLPPDHWFVSIIKTQQYREPLEQLSALRNYAAHESSVSKKTALRAVNQQRMSSAGSWLKLQYRLDNIADGLKTLALQVKQATPN